MTEVQGSFSDTFTQDWRIYSDARFRLIRKWKQNLDSQYTYGCNYYVENAVAITKIS